MAELNWLDPTHAPDAVLSLAGQFFVYGPIREAGAYQLTQRITRFLYAHRETPEKPPVVVRLHTPGGEFYALMLLTGVLEEARALGFAVHTSATMAMSAGSVLLQYGTVRTVDTQGCIMLHDVQGTAGHGGKKERQVDEAIFEGMRRQVARIYAGRNTAGHTDPEWWLDNYMNQEVYMTAREALDLGLVDQIAGDLPRPPARQYTS